MTSAKSDQEQIIALEKKLLEAFCNYDVATLDELIHEDALFVLPTGQTISKATVLDNYRNRVMTMTITPSDPVINVTGDTAIISVNLKLHGKSADKEINSQFRYLRVWKLVNDRWKIIATGGTPMNQ